MPILFATTLLLSAVLVFLIEPMFAKMVLPRLGGTPAVWNTSLVCYQALLLAGYAYAHLLPRWIGTRRHVYFHMALLLLPVLALPPQLPWNAIPPGDGSPIPWLLALLALTVGLPFFVLCTTAPLLQRWFSQVGHRSSGDPYFLYAASNIGSLAALAAYPFFFEPVLTLRSQSLVWSGGYGIFVVLVAVCGVVLLRHPLARDAATVKPRQALPNTRLSDPRRVLRWLALAFVPSGLLLSVTSYLTTDIAAIPLLWVIPLAVYLLTFVLAFARRQWLSHVVLMRVLPLLVMLLAVSMLAAATDPLWILLPLHLIVFFTISMVCHRELAIDRPPVAELTSYYLWISLGGVLGGGFCALVAPLLFPGLAEYPLLLVAGCLLRPTLPFGAEGDKEAPVNPKQIMAGDLAFPAAVWLLTTALVVGSQFLGQEHGPLSVGLMFGVPALLCYTFLHRPVRFGLGIGALFLGGVFYQGVYGGTLHRERSFFGVHRITIDASRQFRQLVHGNTIHGRQSLRPEERREPLTYYARSGPIGQVFAVLAKDEEAAPVGVVGLGAGSLAAYAAPNQAFTFFEIDPTVERLARDPRYFTFLADAPTAIPVVLGDARLTLQGSAGRDGSRYRLLVIDAFSSDAIPLHLLTREAVDLYRSRLTENGVLAFNISNRYLDLEPVLAGLARAAGCKAFIQRDLELRAEERDKGKTASEWIVVVRDKAHLDRLLDDPRWREARAGRVRGVWTDDYSNLFSVFRW